MVFCSGVICSYVRGLNLSPRRSSLGESSLGAVWAWATLRKPVTSAQTAPWTRFISPPVNSARIISRPASTMSNSEAPDEGREDRHTDGGRGCPRPEFRNQDGGVPGLRGWPPSDGNSARLGRTHPRQFRRSRQRRPLHSSVDPREHPHHRSDGRNLA